MQYNLYLIQEDNEGTEVQPQRGPPGRRPFWAPNWGPGGPRGAPRGAFRGGRGGYYPAPIMPPYGMFDRSMRGGMNPGRGGYGRGYFRQPRGYRGGPPMQRGDYPGPNRRPYKNNKGGSKKKEDIDEENNKKMVESL